MLEVTISAPSAMILSNFFIAFSSQDELFCLSLWRLRLPAAAIMVGTATREARATMEMVVIIVPVTVLVTATGEATATAGSMALCARPGLSTGKEGTGLGLPVVKRCVKPPPHGQAFVFKRELRIDDLT